LVKTLVEETIELLVHRNMDITELKKLIYDKKGISTGDQRFIFHEQVLEEGRTLGEYCIQSEDIIHLQLIVRDEMYCFTSGQQDFRNLSSDTADAIKNILLFNIKHVKHVHHLSSAKLQEFILQGRAALSVLYRAIPDITSIISSIPTDEEDGSDSEDDDIPSDERQLPVQHQLRVYRLLEREVLKDLLIKEEQMRLSEQTQLLLSSVEDRKDIDWMDVIADLQTKLIKETIGDDATEDEIQHGLR
jgi:hypothetical protein